LKCILHAHTKTLFSLYISTRSLIMCTSVTRHMHAPHLPTHIPTPTHTPTPSPTPTHIHTYAHTYAHTRTTAEQNQRQDSNTSTTTSRSATPPPSTQATPSHGDEPAEPELRSRFAPTSGTSQGSRDHGDASATISLRLILSQNSMTIDVRPSCTLGEIRRYTILHCGQA